MGTIDDSSLCPKCGAPMGASPDGNGLVCRPCVMARLMGGGGSPQASEQVADADAYEIHESIGKGGAGTIYRATENKMGRLVALKLLNTSDGEIEAAKRRFLIEVRAVAALDHAGIVPIYATGEIDGRPFFAMRYLENGSLASHLEEFEGPKKASSLIVKISRAIHHAHARGVLHRDLKPSNILLDEHGEPLVSDFGLAKFDSDTDDLTLTGAVMGTPQHMSPEQARGDNAAVTTASDVFSLGTIFYQLLCGRTPFSGESSHAVMRDIIEREAEFTKSDLPGIDRDLRTICLKCLEKDPARRYSSALALAEDLERWEAGEPIRARSTTASERFRRWVKSHPWKVVALLMLIVGTIASITLWRQAEAARVVADHNATIAEENADFATVANALAARERFDFGQARRLLDRVPPERRGFEWGLVNGLLDGEYEWSLDFGGALPVDVSCDAKGERIAVLTDDRKLHFVDPREQAIVETMELGSPDRFRNHPFLERSQYQLKPTSLASSAKMAQDFITALPGPRFLSLSPDGRHFAYVDGFVLLINEVESGETIHLGWVFGARPVWLDSDTLLFGNAADPIAGHRSDTLVHRMSTGTTSHLPVDLMAPLACPPNGKLVALVRNDKEVLLFERKDAFYNDQPLQKIVGEQGIVTGLEIDTAETHVAIVWREERESKLSVFEIASGDEVFSQSFPAAPTIAFWPGSDSPVLAIAGRETWLSSWELASTKDGLEKASRSNLSGWRRFPMNQRILNAPRLPDFHFGHEGPVGVVLPLPGDHSRIITASSDGRIAAWQRVSKETDQNRRENVETSLANHRPMASPNGEHVFYRGKGEDGISAPRVWHREEGQESVFPHDYAPVAVFDDGRVMTMQYPYQLEGKPPGGKRDYICWQSRANQAPVELWRIKDCHLPWGYPLSGGVAALDGRIAALFTGSVHVFDLNRLEEQESSIHERWQAYRAKFFSIRGGKVPGRTLAISPDGKFLAITGHSNSFHLFDLDRSFSDDNPELRPQERLTPPASLRVLESREMFEYGSAVRDCACAFGADSSRLYIGNENGKIHVFDLKNNFKLLPDESWQAHSNAITALVVSQSGEIIATAGGNSMTLWSAEKEEGKPRRNRLHLNTGEHPRNWIQFCADDSVLFHSSAAGVIEAWEVKK